MSRVGRVHHVVSRSAIGAATLSLLLLQSCGNNTDSDAEQPSAKGPVLMTIWDIETGDKTLVEAAAIDLVGENYDIVQLQQPRLRLPVRGGLIYLSAAIATLNNNGDVNGEDVDDTNSSEEIIEINQEIQIQGEIDSKPVNGTAESARFDKSANNCDLHNADFIWGKQHVTVKTLHLKSSTILSGEDWHQEPIGVAGEHVGGE